MEEEKIESNYKISRFNKIVIWFIVLASFISVFIYIKAGAPHSGGNISSNPATTSYSSNTNGHSDSFNLIMGAALTVVQLITFLTVVIAFLVSLVKMIKTKIAYKKAKEKSEQEGTLDPETLNVKRIIAAKTFKAYVFAIIFYIIFSWIFSSIRTFAKPIIYLYPEENSTRIEVNLSHPEDITCSYPKYNDGWTVLANTDGTLKLEGNNREYYSLYWEGNNHRDNKIKEGFVVKGEDTAEFLEEKLSLLGLTDKEAEEFIVYWLPKMEKNNYNLIRFIPIDELNEENELIVTPKPDTLIRVMMEYKPLLFKINVEEQQLEEVTREGFTVVEWGGTEL